MNKLIERVDINFKVSIYALKKNAKESFGIPYEDF